MRWPWEQGEKGVEPDPEPPARHHSLGLGLVLDRLQPETRHDVLDLGPAVGGNLDLLSRRSCRVRIADFHRSLMAEPLPQREPGVFGALVTRLLAFDPDERFDAVLAWDLFDYLRPDQIAALSAHVAAACRPRAALLALVSTASLIPLIPLRYRILDRETLVPEGPRGPTRPNPRHAPATIARLLAGFELESSFVLRNRIQEYVFSRAKTS